MRILQVIPVADSFRVFLADLAEYLVGEGHEVLSVFNPVGGIMESPDNASGRVAAVDFPRGSNPLKHLKAAGKLRGLIKDFQPDVVHAHLSSGILSAALARKLGTEMGAAWMGTFQGLQFPYATGLGGALTRSAECWSAASMDEVHVLTDDDRDALSGAAPKANVVRQDAFGFGCHDRFFDTLIPTGEARRASREALGLKESDRVFIFIGRLVAHKGFHLAARAFMRAQADSSDMKWLVIGEVDPIHPTGLLEAEWRAYQENSSIIRFGVQYDVLPYLDLADAYLFPTKREGMPVSVMEALARRRPVLTNEVRGCRELIRPGENGAYFKSQGAGDMARELIEFRPYVAAEPNPLTRRSVWVKHTLDNYKRLLSIAES
jgi:glycosyltransferase involved in cell wall biosynthesis